ncbi:beta-lactamase/transpeptidase-like protein [Glarea lozoyensis ATCC 20868]|uniref:Beta-lactamase/transpeptidase-like protein n=1 Tax=Glarea lozoyensis (strain ATCC 20868 / MF5171) TaxID=1116229 RepID=S3DCB2_GLAL2|nr:beta-lactamase/transpeptidase-like protein [Glarea lozoyensis ATCC 20868]EPE34729.1 beta-lactamase/transpeptidase-like protein [Glarea lozoyensis ATCC 20868]
MADFEKTYQDAFEAGLLPGVALLASNKDGTFHYSKTIGVRSLAESSTPQPMQLDSILGIASCTKLMTAISVLQCVERGLLDLDADVSDILPETSEFGVITAFDEVKNEATIIPRTKKMTLGHLLTHTSGYTYDLITPLLTSWRVSCSETPWLGGTIPQKCTLPLLFEPGTSWMYGCSLEWAGKAVERATGLTLEEYMKANIWSPLGLDDITFYPKEREDMKERMATLAMLDPDGIAVDASDFDMNAGATDCLGGGGAFASMPAYFTLLQAVMREDPKLLSKASYEELWRPQLDDVCKEAFNELIKTDDMWYTILGVGVPREARKDWCFAGLVCEEGFEGGHSKGTVLWGGLPCLVWFIDREKGLCGIAGAQVMPPMEPRIMDLHEGFQKGIYDVFAKAGEEVVGGDEGR